MKSLRTILVVAVMILVAIGLQISESSAEQYNLKFASPGGMALEISKFGDWLCKELEKRSKGRIRTQYYHSGQMGGTMELAEKLQSGIIQGALMSASHMSNFNPTIGVLNLPFIITDYEIADKFLNSPLMDPIYNGLSKMGITGVEMTEFGFYSVGTRKPISTFQELQDARLKSRSPDSKMHMDIHRALGMRPVPIPFPEVYSSLQQGVIDAMDTSPEMIKLLKFNEVIGNLILTRHFYGAEIVWFSTKWLDSLPLDLRKLVLDTTKEGAALYRKASRDKEKRLLKFFKEGGVRLVVVSDEDKKKFRKAGEKVHEEYGAKIGLDYLTEVYQVVGYKK